MAELTKYIIAMTNLYGMVPKEKVVEIYNNHHQDQVSISEVEEYLDNPPAEPFIFNGADIIDFKSGIKVGRNDPCTLWQREEV